MDGHIARLLNIGVAMMLLVFGLSVFFVRMMPLMTYESDGAIMTDSRFTDSGSVHDDPATKSEIFWLLKDGNKTSLTEGGPGISVYIDGTYCPGAADHNSRRLLAQTISGLTAETYDKVITLNEEGEIRAIDYRGR